MLDNVATLLGFVATLAKGAWIGALLFVVGVALLWVSRALDDRGPVRSYKSSRKAVKAVRRPVR